MRPVLNDKLVDVTTCMSEPTKIEIQREDLRQIREEYLRERRLYIDAEHKAIGSFARALLTLSAGALGLSLTFVRFAVGVPKHTGWLLATWIFFALSLVIITTALYTSHSAFQEGRSIVRKNYEATKADYLANYGKKPRGHVYTEVDKTNQAAEDTDTYNRLAFGFFICGSITLIIFVAVNF